MPPKSSSRCSHATLTFQPSSHAAEAGYRRQTHQQRVAAATSEVNRNGKCTIDLTGDDDISPSSFPAALVLPDDALSIDPTDPPQSLRSWVRGQHRNKVTPGRRTVYLAAPLSFEADVAFAQKWAHPKGARGTATERVKVDLNDVLEYLRAFYHGLPVQLLPSAQIPIFTNDIDDTESNVSSKGKHERQTLWLNTRTASGCVGIRSRATPKGEFSHQFNLNDLLEAAIDILPEDAYALLLLVEHDIYEDEEDEFACGRAYGGSRIAVISTARYNPVLDLEQGIEREHGWPASHCERYVKWCAEGIEDIEVSKKGSRAGKTQDRAQSAEGLMSPMEAALVAHNSVPSLGSGRPSAAALSALWLARVCRTAAHELGHCFGIGHCVYYACSMQGTASIIEDARQPLYLCPVDLAKVVHATGVDVKERYMALLKFCEKKSDGQLFKAHAAWIEARLAEMEKAE